MQAYATRFENGKWVQHVLTDWDKPVEFSGRGSMGFIGIKVGGLTKAMPGVFTMNYRHRDYGSGQLVVDAKTLQPTDIDVPAVTIYPKQLSRLESDFRGIGIRRADDIGTSGEVGVRYFLQWETLGKNQDRARKGPLPKPSMLRLNRLSSH